jgi:dipeptidase
MFFDRVLCAIVVVVIFTVGFAEDAPVEFNPAKLDRCTTMIVGKKAGVDGPMTTHTADCLDCDFRASKVPAANHPKGSMRNCYLYKGDYPQSVMEDRGATWKVANLEGTDEQKQAWGTQSEIVMTIPEVSIYYSSC